MDFKAHSPFHQIHQWIYHYPQLPLATFHHQNQSLFEPFNRSTHFSRETPSKGGSFPGKAEGGALLAVIFGDLGPLMGGDLFGTTLRKGEQQTAEAREDHATASAVGGFGDYSMQPRW